MQPFVIPRCRERENRQTCVHTMLELIPVSEEVTTLMTLLFPVVAKFYTLEKGEVNVFYIVIVTYRESPFSSPFNASIRLLYD